MWNRKEAGDLCKKGHILKRSPKGKLYCSACNSESRRRRGLRAHLMDAPADCPKCGNERVRKFNGRVECAVCEKDYRFRRGARALLLPPVTVVCKKHETLKRRKPSGNTACYLCEAERQAKKYEENPEPFRQRRRRWDKKIGREVLNQRRKEYMDRQHPLYKTWLDINYRCHGKRDFAGYRKRNRSVYPEWRLVSGHKKADVVENKRRFLNFVEYIETQLGPKPEGYSLDRWPSTDGNYEPNNLRWATPKQQANNTIKKIEYREDVYLGTRIEMNGRLESLIKISRITGIHRDVVRDRFALFGTIESILNTNKLVQRKYLYKNHLYAMYELAIIAKVPYATISCRILKYKWSVEKAIESPILEEVEVEPLWLKRMNERSD